MNVEKITDNETVFDGILTHWMLSSLQGVKDTHFLCRRLSDTPGPSPIEYSDISSAVDPTSVDFWTGIKLLKEDPTKWVYLSLNQNWEPSSRIKDQDPGEWPRWTRRKDVLWPRVPSVSFCLGPSLELHKILDRNLQWEVVKMS